MQLYLFYYFNIFIACDVSSQGYFFSPYEPCVTGTSILAPLVLNLNRKTATNVLNTIESLVANWEEKFPCEEGRDRAIQRGRHSPVIVQPEELQISSVILREQRIRCRLRRRGSANILSFSSGTGDLNFSTVIEVPSKLQFFFTFWVFMRRYYSFTCVIYASIWHNACAVRDGPLEK